MRGLGYRPSPPKKPGEKPDFDARAKLRAGPVPVRSDNRHLVLDVLNQGGLGSCVAHAVMQAVRASQVRQGAVSPPLGSRLWTYYIARAAMNEQNEDNGTYIRLAFSGIAKLGFPPESDWPYSDHGDAFRTAPPPGVTRAAYDQRRPTEYHRILSTGRARVDDVKRALGDGYLVCFGTLVSNRFCGDDLGRGPVLPPVLDPIAGGHAMALVGHDGDAFDVVNSWGTAWGAGGFWTMSADYLMWSETNDLWIVEAAPPFSGTTS